MGFFRRRPKSNAESAQTEVGDERAPFSGAVLGPRTVHERIEVTVEREWVSMVVRNPGAASIVNAATAAETPAEVEIEAERALEAPDPETPQAE